MADYYTRGYFINFYSQTSWNYIKQDHIKGMNTMNMHYISQNKSCLVKVTLHVVQNNLVIGKQTVFPSVFLLN